jgi:hypothetical protein
MSYLGSVAYAGEQRVRSHADILTVVGSVRVYPSGAALEGGPAMDEGGGLCVACGLW